MENIIMEKIAMILEVFSLGILADRERKSVCCVRYKKVASPAIARAYILAIARMYGENATYSVEYGGVKKVLFKSTDSQIAYFENTTSASHYWQITIWNGYKIVAMFRFNWEE